MKFVTRAAKMDNRSSMSLKMKAVVITIVILSCEGRTNPSSIMLPNIGTDAGYEVISSTDSRPIMIFRHYHEYAFLIPSYASTILSGDKSGVRWICEEIDTLLHYNILGFWAFHSLLYDLDHCCTVLQSEEGVEGCHYSHWWYVCLSDFFYAWRA